MICSKSAEKHICTERRWLDQTLYNVGIRPRGRPKKTWWDCVKNDRERL